MKFLVLMWAIFLIFAVISSDLDTETYNLINSTNLAKPGCETRCGDLIVPYPFGIGNNTNCSISKGFNIYCNKSFNPPKASFYGKRSTWIKRISDSTFRTTNIVIKSCCFANGFSSSNEGFWSHKSRIKSFSNVNKFTVIGCDGYAWLTSATNNRTVSTGCIVYCSKPEELVGDDECSGNGCCQSSIPQDIYNFTVRITTVNRVNSSDRLFAPCTYAFIGEENVFKFNGAIDLPANGEDDTSFNLVCMTGVLLI